MPFLRLLISPIKVNAQQRRYRNRQNTGKRICLPGIFLHKFAEPLEKERMFLYNAYIIS